MESTRLFVRRPSLCGVSKEQGLNGVSVRVIHRTMLEVCIDSLESALNAIHGGADELEICSSLAEGGLTPTAGLVKEILNAVSNVLSKKPIHKRCTTKCACQQIKKKPKINVMLRCRAGSDFCFSPEEMDTMIADLEVFNSMGVDRYVFGALTTDGDIHKDNCKKIIEKACNVPVTFHRAFDVCREPINSLEAIVRLGFNRILTSGKKPSAGDAEAKALIKSLIEFSDGRIEIMPGAGVNVDNAKSLIDIGCKIVHSSCKTMVKLPVVGRSLTMGTNESEYICVTNERLVKQLKELLNASSKV